MTNAQYTRLTWGLIFGWFTVAFLASAFHLLRSGPSSPPLALGLAAISPLVIFAVWYTISPGFRSFVLSLNPQTLTLIQSWRIVGYALLVASAYRLLPAFFAQSAGWGDMFIGLTAPFVALRLVNPEHKASFLLWNWLGIADLVTAVTLGTISPFISPHGIPASAMSVLPFSVIPAFGVPLLAILHIITIAQARSWRINRLAEGQLVFSKP
jgi:hypothetical protein